MLSEDDNYYFESLLTWVPVAPYFSLTATTWVFTGSFHFPSGCRSLEQTAPGDPYKFKFGNYKVVHRSAVSSLCERTQRADTLHNAFSCVLRCMYWNGSVTESKEGGDYSQEMLRYTYRNKEKNAKFHCSVQHMHCLTKIHLKSMSLFLQFLTLGTTWQYAILCNGFQPTLFSM